LNIGIVGLGLMGGSFAKAVKRYGIAKNIYGFANSEKNKKDILELKLVDELVDLKTVQFRSSN
jgi:prephenate dehydrogenase